MIIRTVLALFAAVASGPPAIAQSGLPPAALSYTQLPDPAQEAAASKLMYDIRCLVCQGQSIADSDSEMAGDMRAMVRRRIAAGEAPDDVRKWLVQRYGRWVSYDPSIDGLTWPLWVMPILLLAIGLWLARGQLRRRRR